MARNSLFDALAEALAGAVADMTIGPAGRGGRQWEAAYLTAMSIICAQAARVVGGEWVYVPRVNQAARQQARERIVQALEAGEPTMNIAQREGVSVSLVKKVRRLRGTIRP